jgi:hypothetical protein
MEGGVGGTRLFEEAPREENGALGAEFGDDLRFAIGAPMMAVEAALPMARAVPFAGGWSIVEHREEPAFQAPRGRGDDGDGVLPEPGGGKFVEREVFAEQQQAAVVRSIRIGRAVGP